jgi:hypothetical protein
LKYLINDNLKQPIIVIPVLLRLDVRKECIPEDCSILPEISTTGEVIPQVGIGHHDGPGNEVPDNDQEK